MMTLRIVSKDYKLLNEIADFLLHEELIANAMLSDGILVKTKAKNGTIENTEQFVLEGISKSLLFSAINKKLREKYMEKMPLVYSEPIILIDSEYTDSFLNSITKV